MCWLRWSHSCNSNSIHLTLELFSAASGTVSRAAQESAPGVSGGIEHAGMVFVSVGQMGWVGGWVGSWMCMGGDGYRWVGEMYMGPVNCTVCVCVCFLPE